MLTSFDFFKRDALSHNLCRTRLSTLAIGKMFSMIMWSLINDWSSSEWSFPLIYQRDQQNLIETSLLPWGEAKTLFPCVPCEVCVTMILIHLPRCACVCGYGIVSVCGIVCSYVIIDNYPQNDQLTPTSSSVQSRWHSSLFSTSPGTRWPADVIEHSDSLYGRCTLEQTQLPEYVKLFLRYCWTIVKNVEN